MNHCKPAINTIKNTDIPTILNAHVNINAISWPKPGYPVGIDGWGGEEKEAPPVCGWESLAAFVPALPDAVMSSAASVLMNENNRNRNMMDAVNPSLTIFIS